MSDIIETVFQAQVAIPTYLQGAVEGKTGIEGASNECFAIPFLKIAQKMGQNNDPKLMPGMFFNTATGSIYGSAVTLIPLHFSRTFVEWEGKYPDAKFIATHTALDFKKTYEPKATKNGSEMVIGNRRFVDNRNFIVLNASVPSDGIMLFSLKSTGIPASKKWLSLIAAVRIKNLEGNIQSPACWTKTWGLTTIPKSFPSGPAFVIDQIKDSGWVPANLAKVAEAAFSEAQTYSDLPIVDPEDDVPKDW